MKRIHVETGQYWQIRMLNPGSCGWNTDSIYMAKVTDFRADLELLILDHDEDIYLHPEYLPDDMTFTRVCINEGAQQATPISTQPDSERS